MSQVFVDRLRNRDGSSGPILTGLSTVSGNLEVTGSVNISGVVTATTLFGDGANLSGLSTEGAFRYDNTSNILSTITNVNNRTTGVHNFLAGTSPGRALTSGSFNNFLGQAAGCSNTTGS